LVRDKKGGNMGYEIDGVFHFANGAKLILPKGVTFKSGGNGTDCMSNGDHFCMLTGRYCGNQYDNESWNAKNPPLPSIYKFIEATEEKKLGGKPNVGNTSVKTELGV